MKEKNLKYSIGLDIGVASVGFSVIDENYKLIRKTHNGVTKNLWGSRLFNQADTAKKRRIYRSTRRRYNKRRERIRQLRYLMNDMVLNVDPTFFIRLENLSFLNEEDKAKHDVFRSNYNLFIDKDFNDKNYYEKFPTIYHLRHFLATSSEKADPRLIYLAIHHILKYRGHFLHEGEKFNINKIDLKQVFHNVLFDIFLETYNEDNLTDELIDNIKKLLEENLKRSEKAEELANLLTKYCINSSDIKKVNELTNMIVGLESNCKELWSDSKLIYSSNNKDNPIKISFSKQFEEDIEKYESQLNEYIETIMEIKVIYDWMMLNEILKDSKDGSISSAMVTKYNEHSEDLRILKEVLKEYNKEGYKQFFKDKKLKYNYYQYINKKMDDDEKKNDNKKKNDKKKKNNGNYIKLLTNVYKLIENIDDKRLDAIKDKISKGIENEEDEVLFRRQTTKYNSLIPYQLHLKELESILNNQAKYYKELEENKDKIIALLTFRIPYYYGPLNPMDLDNHWIVKQSGKENERITAWNHQEIVDVDKTSENFMNRMINYCTYLVDEPVLPKNSLIVSKFEVLNELNKIRANGKLLDVATKIKIFEELFMQNSMIKDETFKNYLKKEQLIPTTTVEITGYQKDKCFSTSLKPWIDFTKIFGIIDEHNFELIEQIIYDITVFKDRSILKRRLERYELDDVKIQKIMALRYNGWSNLSKKLLNGIYTTYEGEEKQTIIDVMMNSNFNLMQILNNDKMAFKHIIEESNKREFYGKFTYEEVQKLHGSPALKKGIWQSLQIIDEIIKIMKCKPQNIFIEFAREESKNKKRTKSRKEKIESLFKEIDGKNKDDDIKYLKKQLKKEDDSLSDRKYLYYMQLGKCMYTGRELNIDYLQDYHIDHIIPRSLVAKDEIDNKVLVLSIENSKKSDFVLSENIRNRQKNSWDSLKEKGLISQKKFDRLMKSEFTKEEIEGFIQRQIVETRQITKHVAQIVSNHLHDTKVFAIRAGLTHGFRKKYGVYKNRNLNDFHHAHDAYIASVLGTFIQRCYPGLEKRFIYTDYAFFKKDNKITGKHSFILNSMDKAHINDETGEVIWSEEILISILKCFNYKDCLITKKLEEYSGKFYDETIYSNNKHSEKKKSEAKVGINKFRSDVSKYGGFSNVFSTPVAIKAKDIELGEEVKKIVSIPKMLLKSSIENQYMYLLNTYEKLQDISIITYIKENQLVEFNGFPYYIVSAREWNRAQQLILSKESQKTLYAVNLANKKGMYDKLEGLSDLYMEILYKMGQYYEYLANKSEKLKTMIDDFNALSKQDQCKIILEILKATKAGKERGNLKILGESTVFGRVYGKKDFNISNVTFISQSVTGFYEKRYKL